MRFSSRRRALYANSRLRLGNGFIPAGSAGHCGPVRSNRLQMKGPVLTGLARGRAGDRLGRLFGAAATGSEVRAADGSRVPV
jgi:hypothetical protein